MSINTLYIRSYTPKSVVVYGNTDKFKEEIKALDGKWNPHLQGIKGWIFPKTRRSSLEAWAEKVVKDFPEYSVMEMSPMNIKAKTRVSKTSTDAGVKVVKNMLLFQICLTVLVAVMFQWRRSYTDMLYTAFESTKDLFCTGLQYVSENVEYASNAARESMVMFYDSFF